MAQERGFFNHIWYKLLDEEGIPVPTASVWIYDYKNPTTELTLFDENGDMLTQPISTDSEGVFEFYVKDHIRSAVDGYEWDTQFIISWSKDDKSGLIRGDHLWGEFKSVNVSGNLARLNKAISNFFGWTIDTHVDFEFGSTNRCGSSSSSSSSTSSSSSSSVSISSSSSSLSSSSSTSSSSTCVQGFVDQTGDPKGIWEWYLWDAGNSRYDAEVNGSWVIVPEPSAGMIDKSPQRLRLVIQNDIGWNPQIDQIFVEDTMGNTMYDSGAGPIALSGGDGVPTTFNIPLGQYGFDIDYVLIDGGSNKIYLNYIGSWQDCGSSSSSSFSTEGT